MYFYIFFIRKWASQIIKLQHHLNQRKLWAIFLSWWDGQDIRWFDLEVPLTKHIYSQKRADLLHKVSTRLQILLITKDQIHEHMALTIKPLDPTVQRSSKLWCDILQQNHIECGNNEWLQAFNGGYRSKKDIKIDGGIK